MYRYCTQTLCLQYFLQTLQKFLQSHFCTGLETLNHLTVAFRHATKKAFSKATNLSICDDVMTSTVRVYYQRVPFHFHHQREFGVTLRFNLSVYHQKTIYMKMGVQSQDSEKANVRIIRGRVKFVTASKLNV